MSLDPTAIPDAPPAPAPEAGAELAEIWRNIWPWDDLNAKGPPERFLKLGLDMLASLAAIVAQGPIGPKLVRARADGSLATGAQINLQAGIGAPSAIGANTITVIDPSVLSPACPVLLQVATGVNAGKTEQQIVQSIAGNVVTLAPGNLLHAYNPGDTCVAMPTIDVFGQPIAVVAAGGGGSTNLALQVRPQVVNATIASGITAALLGGTAGQTVFLFGVAIAFDAVVGSNGMFLEDSAGTQLWNLSLAAGPQYVDYHGAPCSAVGAGISMINGSSGSVTVRGTLNYAKS